MSIRKCIAILLTSVGICLVLLFLAAPFIEFGFKVGMILYAMVSVFLLFCAAIAWGIAELIEPKR